jgi:hypothetical protein
MEAQVLLKTPLKDKMKSKNANEHVKNEEDHGQERLFLRWMASKLQKMHLQSPGEGSTDPSPVKAKWDTSERTKHLSQHLMTSRKGRDGVCLC